MKILITGETEIELPLSETKGMIKDFMEDLNFHTVSIKTSDVYSKAVQRIHDAIYEVTGLTLKDYAVKGNTLKFYFPRMIFIYQCSKKKMHPKDIAVLINRDRTTVLAVLSKYDNECAVNKEFKKLAGRVEFIIHRR